MDRNKLLKSLRKKAGKTVYDVSYETGVSYTTYVAFEKNNKRLKSPHFLAVLSDYIKDELHATDDQLAVIMKEG